MQVDPVQYGALIQKVDHLEKMMDAQSLQIAELLALANKGKGGFWFGMTMVSAIGATIGYAISFWRH